MRLRLPYLLLLALLAFASSLQASSWINMGMTNNWNDSGNWSGGQVPGSGDAAYIGTGYTPYVTTAVTDQQRRSDGTREQAHKTESPDNRRRSYRQHSDQQVEHR